MSNRSSTISLIRWMSAGLEASVLGGLAGVGLIVVLSGFSGMRWYRYGNLFAVGLYPSTVLDAGFGYWSLAGFALAFLYFVAQGLLFAMIFRSRRRGLAPHLVGVAYALLLYIVGDRFWWQAWSPYLVIYGNPTQLMWGHIAFGAMLGWIPALLESHEATGELDTRNHETFSSSDPP